MKNGVLGGRAARSMIRDPLCRQLAPYRVVSSLQLLRARSCADSSNRRHDLDPVAFAIDEYGPDRELRLDPARPDLQIAVCAWPIVKRGVSRIGVKKRRGR